MYLIIILRFILFVLYGMIVVAIRIVSSDFYPTVCYFSDSKIAGCMFIVHFLIKPRNYTDIREGRHQLNGERNVAHHKMNIYLYIYSALS